MVGENLIGAENFTVEVASHQHRSKVRVVMGSPHPKGLTPSYPFTMTVPHHIFGNSVAIEQSLPRCTNRGVSNWAKVHFLEVRQSFILLRISHNVGFGIPGVDNDRRRFRPHPFGRAKGR
jgi:hypothetical protein